MSIPSEDHQRILVDAGYDVGDATLPPEFPRKGLHTHDFDVWNLVVGGEITLNFADHSTTYRVGDAFKLDAGTLHEEAVGPDGVRMTTGVRQLTS